MFLRASAQSDSVAQALVKSLGSPDALAALKHSSVNEALSRLAQAKDNFEQIAVYPDKLVRKRQPIYDMPDNPYGRAHLYSPAKRLGSVLIPTPLFNCAVIWLLVGLLYVTLYFDLLRHLLEHFENLKKRRLAKRLAKLRI